MTGARLKEVLEDVADNLFNPDPYYQQGGDMVRVGGVRYTIDIGKPIGSRISDLTLLRTGKPLDAAQGLRRCRLGERERGHAKARRSGTSSSSYIRKKGVVAPKETDHVRVTGA